MRTIMISLLLALGLTLSSIFPATAGPVEDGRAAYEAGDYVLALRLFEQVAEQGNATAQAMVGYMYDNGLGVSQDDIKAVKWYRLAAEQGNAYAQNNLGYRYDNGLGLPLDRAEAAKWYRLAAEQGNANARNRLGYMYSIGLGVRQDYAEAVRWYRLAAEEGDAVAKYKLGLAYYNGVVVPQDYTEAVRWYRLAAEQGDANAQYYLGAMYDRGQGVPQDQAEAAKWYGKAADQGNPTAKSRLAEIHTQAEPLHALGRRVALVIGNSQYANVPRLYNVGRDATDVSDALERVGFQVSRVRDADYGQMRSVLQKFSADADGAEIALIYYAGHGIEVENKNYLVPIDAQLKSDRDIDFETISLALVEGAVSGAKTLRMVVLDACRNNPFAVEMALSSPTRSIGRGLSAVEPARGVLIAYSAKGGSLAKDVGDGRNSPFASAFIEYLDDPGLDVGFMFRKISDAVMRSTDNQQEPFVYGRLPGDPVYLVAPVPAS